MSDPTVGPRAEAPPIEASPPPDGALPNIELREQWLKAWPAVKALVESPGWSALVNEVLLYGDAPPAQEHLPAGPFTVGPFVDQGDGTVKASLTTPEMMLLPSREQRERAQAWLAGKLTADALHFPPMPCFLCDATPCICGRAL